MRPRVGPVVVIGGANSDVVGRACAPLVPADSNPGHISRSAGGVGRNIAENLARLGAPTSLITAFGDDAAARELAAGCTELGIDISSAVTAEGVPGATYLAILDDTGDMSLAVNDMRALEAITPEVIGRASTVLRAASVVVVDANLSADALTAIADEARSGLILDPVSVAKAPRAADILARLACVKCNAAEARRLLGLGAGVEESAEALAELLRDAGVATAIVSDGRRGVAFATKDESGTVPAPSVRVVNATGAGDAFTAGVAFAFAANRSVHDAVDMGSHLAALALASESTVSPDVGPRVADEWMRRWGA